jgi:hypothetical protein
LPHPSCLHSNFFSELALAPLLRFFAGGASGISSEGLPAASALWSLMSSSSARRCLEVGLCVSVMVRQRRGRVESKRFRSNLRRKQPGLVWQDSNLSLERPFSLITSQQDYPGKPDCIWKVLITFFFSGACVILFPRYDILTAALL